MVMFRVARLVLSLALLSVLAHHPAHAQDTGVAVITDPLDGTIVSGLVPLSGTATHPQFVRYELAFGYSPNPTDTWFTLQDPALTQVVSDVLGRWDTTTLSDGLYVLRLRVYWSDKNYLEAFARNIRVQNTPPTATPLPTAIDAPPPTQPTLPPPPAGATASPPLVILPPPSTPRPTTSAIINLGGDSSEPNTQFNSDLIRAAFLDGMRVTFIIFALIGLYVLVRAGLRAWLK